MREGYSFRWDAGCKPLLVLPDGEEVVLDVINDVPIWPIKRQGYAGAAPEASSRSETRLEEESSTEEAPTTNDKSLVEESPTQTLGEQSPTKDNNIPEEHFLTHMPKHPTCPACQAAQLQHRHCRIQKHDEKGLPRTSSAAGLQPITS
jgi:hypothetical protein